jgi:diguanylate cyclase (GGDEF)-like protein/PAS domain S-box-containing protein
MPREQTGRQEGAAPPGDIDYPGVLSAVGGILMTVADSDGVLEFVSPACERMLGWGPAELVGTRADLLLHPDDVLDVGAAHARQVGDMSISIDCRMRTSNGEYLWVEIISSCVDWGGSAREVSIVHDITDRRQQVADLESRASTDALTGVVNRSVLVDRLGLALRRLGRSKGVVAVLYLDLDHLKVVNDSLGHRVGDDILLNMAQRLTQHLRSGDTLARLGGDEFVIVAEDMADENAAIGMANRVINAGREPFQVGDHEFECTLSIGIACTADSQRSVHDLLCESDMALHRAKDRGRNRAELFDEELRTKAVGRLITERMLHSAIAEDRVVVEYQPVVDLCSNAVVSAEALMRIRDSRGELRLPNTFLEVAEETDLLITLDARVLADAVTQAAGWVSRLAPSAFAGVAVNITARHLADAAFPRTVIAMLDAANLPRNWLQVEVTERVLMEASNSAMSGLRALRAAGIQVGLDDFGTGYSSFAYLRRFPLDYVKLDKLFIDDLELDPKEWSIASAIITLCHALGLTVIAEGVETTRQAEILSSLGCDRAQGYLYHRSTTPAGIDAIVLHHLETAKRTPTEANGSGEPPGYPPAIGTKLLRASAAPTDSSARRSAQPGTTQTSA